MRKQVLSLLVENTSGVLSHISGLFSRCLLYTSVYGLSEYYISQNPKREYPILLLGYGGLTEGQIADGLQMIDGILAELKKYQPISVHKE